MSLVDRIHETHVSPRRIRVLARHLAPLVPEGAGVLDVGCGDGFLSSLLLQHRPDLALKGLDVLIRDRTYIPVERFDGQVIPYGDQSFDVVMFLDTLHHTTDPMVLLREGVRVARRALVIKDHTRDGVLAAATLRLMDRIGNARFGVALPYTYWPTHQWLEAVASLGLTVGEWKSALGLYPWPATWLFDRSLHFIARLDIPVERRH